ncbi:MAG: hypothetical protein ACI4GX_00635 [Ruminococcus sp.]
MNLKYLSIQFSTSALSIIENAITRHITNITLSIFENVLTGKSRNSRVNAQAYSNSKFRVDFWSYE